MRRACAYTGKSPRQSDHFCPVASPATRAHEGDRMDFAAEELMDELTRINSLMQEAVRHAGQGVIPELDGRLDACLRSLRPMLHADDFTVAADAIEAAKRVMSAADPSAPLLMLGMAQKTLTGVLRRQASRQRLRAA
jgi:UTP:GlnB (protein PII) uridylyltransferase